MILLRRYPFFFQISNRLLGGIFAIAVLFTCSGEVPEVRTTSKLNACTKISGLPGPEDIELIETGGKSYLIISSHERRTPNQDGNLFYIELTDNSLAKKEFKINKLPIDKLPKYFRPHGISHSTYKGKNRIYAISHPSFGNPEFDPSQSSPHTIEVFEELTGQKFQWKHVSTLSNETLFSPNDLFALPEEKLLISNDGSGSGQFWFFIDFLFNRNTADITYFDSGKFYLANEKIPFGNGIWYKESGSEKTLYRASHLDKSIYVYSVNWVENHAPLLKLQYKIGFPGGVDNLFLNEYGFIAGVHLSNMKFLDHSKSSESHSPSQIYRITNQNIPELLYSNKGDEISAISGGLIYKNTLFISQVFDDFILACEID
jgi:hypothetical protein